MKLTDIKSIRALMEKHHIQFQKKFGQNFLLNESILQRIAEEASGNVIEIGPGVGVLTRELSRNAEKVVAIEIDSGLIPVLAETLSDCDNVKVIHADVMKIDLNRLVEEEFQGETVSICANLPYNITTPVIMRLLESGVRIHHMTLMVQKEVADRFCSKAGTEAYGAVTALLAYYGHAEKLFHVAAGNFIPAPKVDSAVIRITLYEKPPAETKDSALLFRIIRAAFEQRRKTLKNALSGLAAKDELSAVLRSCGLDENIRGERLDIEQFIMLSNALYARKNNQSVT